MNPTISASWIIGGGEVNSSEGFRNTSRRCFVTLFLSFSFLVSVFHDDSHTRETRSKTRTIKSSLPPHVFLCLIQMTVHVLPMAAPPPYYRASATTYCCMTLSCCLCFGGEEKIIIRLLCLPFGSGRYCGSVACKVSYPGLPFFLWKTIVQSGMYEILTVNCTRDFLLYRPVSFAFLESRTLFLLAKDKREE